MNEKITPDETARKVSRWEQHVTTVIVGITMLLVGWVGTSALQGREKSVEAAGEIKLLAAQVGELRNGVTELKGLVLLMQGNYVARDDFRDHETRLRDLERKLRGAQQ